MCQGQTFYFERTASSAVNEIKNYIIFSEFRNLLIKFNTAEARNLDHLRVRVVERGRPCRT